ncbi:hypothetical protein SAMN05421676_101475 [Salinibacillus kushneri]|uniref:Uncharacterized protein n=1 Tax=Salinibacillus kushneri TaxID=237682 RepID=A0A1H9ZDW4_9BACI|nr:hypothetical protein [Salinibacillus kushneri]SES79670.1 hypothetical protein SAMN05421676_101475 [Salinibacillus kushneri]
MPRQKRIWFPGANLHITTRGVKRTTLIHDDVDYLECLRILEESPISLFFFNQFHKMK